MFSTMKVTGFLLVVVLNARFGLSGPSGRIQDMSVVDELSQNMMNDPMGTIQAYYDHAEPFMMKSNLRYHILANGRAFNLTLVDVRLVLAQTQEQFKIVFDLHFQNTSPLMKSPLTVFMNSFLHAIHKLNNFISNSNSSVNSAMMTSGSAIQAAMIRATNAVGELQTCANTNNLTSDVNFVEELNLCFSREIVNFTLEFNEYINHLNLFKGFFPEALMDFANCLLTNQNMTEIRPVLEMSRCMGVTETKRFKDFYDILNGGNEHMIKLVTKIVRMSTRFNECRVKNVNDFNAFLAKNNNARFGLSGSSGTIQDISVVDELSQNMMSDPMGTIQAYYDNAEPFMMKSNLRYHILANVRAFNLTLIDVRLVLNQTQEHFKIIFDQHSQNTSPLMKIPLTVMMNGFLQVIHKLNNFISNSNSSVNNAMRTSGPAIHAAMIRATNAVGELQACANTNNLTSDVNFVEELNLCFNREIVNFTLEFNEYINHLNLFKGFFPEAMVDFYDCLVTNQNMTEIRSVLEMSKCIGVTERKRLRDLYNILNGGNEHMINLVTKIVRMSTVFNECRVKNVNDFKAFLAKNNISCN